MSNETDGRNLERLFLSASSDLEPDEFLSGIQAGLDAARGRRRMIHIGALILAGVAFYVMALPMSGLMTAFIEALSTPLVPIDHPLLARLLLPINTFEGIAAIVMLATRALFKRLHILRWA